MAASEYRGPSGPAGSDPARESILTRASACESHFDEGLRLLSSNHEDQIYATGLSRLQQRFKDWAGYLGVFASGNGSLDQRLKRHPQHRDLVVYALDMLKGNLLQIMAEPGDQDSDDSSDEDDDRRETEIEGIRMSINELDRLAIHIRQSSRSSLDTRVKAFASKRSVEISSFETKAVLAIKALYPNAQESLRQHLSKSMVHRYTKLLYWQSHDKKLRADHRRLRPSRELQIERTPAPLPLQSVPPQQAVKDGSDTTRPKPVARRGSIGFSFLSETFASDPASHPSMPPKAIEPARRRAGATTVLETGAQFPKPPRFEDEDETAPCPLCRKVFPKHDFANDVWWKSHVNEDLVPFACVETSCLESPNFARRADWRVHIEQDHGAVWQQGPIIPQNSENKPHGSDSQCAFDNAPIGDICPLCCYAPLEESGKHRARNLQTSGESSEALQPESKDASDETAGRKTVRFDVPEEEESLADPGSPTTPRLEMKSTRHKMMTDHIAGHLQFLALLTPRLSTKNLADGEDTDFASSQAPSGDSNPGERSTLGDEFELEEVQRSQSINMRESFGETDPVPDPEESIAPQDEDIPPTEPMDWELFAPPDPSHVEEDKIIKHMREAGNLMNLLKNAANRFAEAGFPIEADEAVQTMTKLLPQRDPYVDFSSGVRFEENLTRESLYEFFNASLSSVDQGVYATLANYCTDEVWEVRSYQDPYQDPDAPAGYLLYSRRALFGLLLNCKRSLDILRCIVVGLSDFDIPLSTETLRSVFPAWDDQVLAAFLQSQSTYDPWGRSNRGTPAPRPLSQALASPLPPHSQVQGSYSPWVSIYGSGSPVPWPAPLSSSTPALQAQNMYTPWGIADIGSPALHPLSLYRSISDSTSLVSLVEDAPETSDQGIQTSQDDMDGQLIQHLYATDLSVVKEHIEGAAGSLPREVYAWIFEDADFQRFLHDPLPKLLWIHGDTGHCRTVLLCGIINDLCEIPDKVISYSFYQETSSHLDTAATVVGELICHLVEQQPSLLVHVREKYELSGKALSDDLMSWKGLCEVLQVMLGHPLMTDAVLIIDDVDERTAEVDELVEFIILSSLRFPLKWIMSSRRDRGIRQPRLYPWGWDDSAEIDLNLAQDQISQAVGAYARYKAECLAVRKHYEDSVRSDIYAYLVFNAGGDFLWVSTVCRELENYTSGDILKFLSSLPAGLASLYDKLHFTTRRTRDGELCQEVLTTVAIVYRPQTVAELKILVKPFELYHRDDGFRYFITSNCGSFLTIRGDTVDFIDRSARDYICSKILPTDAALQHKHVFTRSLVSLSGILHRDMYALGTTGQPYSRIHQPNPDLLAPVRYAAMYWIHHFAAHSGLVESEGTSAHADLISVLTFLRMFGLFWLESQMLIQGDIDIPGMEKFIDLFDAEDWTPLKDLRDLTQGLIRLSTEFKPAFQVSPMQLYASALVFSEAESPVRQHFKEQAPLWVTGQAISNSSFEVDLSRIQVLELTPDASLLAIVAGDHIIIRNMSTLETTWMFRAEGVSCISFSYHPWLACGTYQGTVRIWDVAKRKAYRRLPRIDEPGVAALTFSSDGCQLVLATLIDSIEIWDVLSSTLVGRFSSTKQLTGRSLRNRGATLFMTDRGPLSIDSRGLAHATEAELETDHHIGFEVSDDDDWITKDGNRVLWLPPLYRASCSTVAGNVVVIGCQAGGVLRFQFA